MRILMAVAVAAVMFLAGFGIGTAVDRDDAGRYDVCSEALAAADEVASTIEMTWATASAAVDAAQHVLADSAYREHAAACRDALAGDRAH